MQDKLGVAPDYVLVDKKAKQRFVELFKNSKKNFTAITRSKALILDIINEKHFLRLSRFIEK